MDVEELRALVRAARRRVVPFVGSGLVLDAGAPRADHLSRWLAAHFGAEGPHDGDLLRTTAELVRTQKLPAVQLAVAEYLAGQEKQYIDHVLHSSRDDKAAAAKVLGVDMGRLG